MRKIFVFFLLSLGLFCPRFVSAQDLGKIIVNQMDILSQEISKTHAGLGQNPDFSKLDMTTSVRSKIQEIIKNRDCELISNLVEVDDEVFLDQDLIEEKENGIVVHGVMLSFNDVKDYGIVDVVLEYDINGRLIDFIIPEGEFIPTPFSTQKSKIDPIVDDNLTQMSDEVLDYLLSLHRINDLRDYLKALKDEGTITFYGDISRVTNRNDYYMVFYTRSGDIVAIFSPAPGRRNLINHTSADVSDFKKCGVELFK